MPATDAIVADLLPGLPADEQDAYRQKLQSWELNREAIERGLKAPWHKGSRAAAGDSGRGPLGAAPAAGPLGPEGLARAALARMARRAVQPVPSFTYRVEYVSPPCAVLLGLFIMREHLCAGHVLTACVIAAPCRPTGAAPAQAALRRLPRTTSALGQGRSSSGAGTAGHSGGGGTFTASQAGRMLGSAAWKTCGTYQTLIRQRCGRGCACGGESCKSGSSVQRFCQRC